MGTDPTYKRLLSDCQKRPTPEQLTTLADFLVKAPQHAVDASPLFYKHLDPALIPDLDSDAAFNSHEREVSFAAISVQAVLDTQLDDEDNPVLYERLMQNWALIWKWLDIMVLFCQGTIKSSRPSPASAAVGRALLAIRASLNLKRSEKPQFASSDILVPLLRLWFASLENPSILLTSIDSDENNMRVNLHRWITFITHHINHTELPQNHAVHAFRRLLDEHPARFADAAIRHLRLHLFSQQKTFKREELHIHFATTLLNNIYNMCHVGNLRGCFPFARTIPLAMEVLRLAGQQPFQKSLILYILLACEMVLRVLQLSTHMNMSSTAAHLKQALQGDILHHLFRLQPWWECVANLEDSDTRDRGECIGKLLEETFTTVLVYRSVLRAAFKACQKHGSAGAFLDAKMGLVSQQWNTLISTIKEYGELHNKLRFDCDRKGCKNNSTTHKMRVCNGCLYSLYCSRSCQRQDWKVGGHRGHCPRVQKQRQDAPQDLLRTSKMQLRLMESIVSHTLRAHRKMIKTLRKNRILGPVVMEVDYAHGPVTVYPVSGDPVTESLRIFKERHHAYPMESDWLILFVITKSGEAQDSKLTALPLERYDEAGSQCIKFDRWMQLEERER